MSVPYKKYGGVYVIVHRLRCFFQADDGQGPQKQRGVSKVDRRLSNKGGKKRLNMRLKILTYISLVMLVAGVALLAVCWLISMGHELSMEKASSRTIIDQIVENMKINEELEDEARQLFLNDRLNRLELVNALAESSPDGAVSNEEWQEAAKSRGLDVIHVIGLDGVILQSSAPACIGLDISDDPRAAEILPLLEDPERVDPVIDLQGVSLAAGEETVNLAIRSDYLGGSVIWIEASPETLTKFEDAYSIERYFGTIPTRHYRTVFAIEEATDQLLGVSANNDQALQIENRKEMLLTALQDPQIMVVNGEKQLVCVQDHEGMLIGCATTLQHMKENVNTYMRVIAACLAGLSVLIVVALFFLIDRLVLRGVENINEGLLRFVSGERDISFGRGSTRDLDELADNLDKVLAVIQLAGTRLSTIANDMGQGVAAYEYYPKLNQFFFSDHLLDIMAMTEEECKARIVEVFQQRVEKVKQNDNEMMDNVESVVTKDGRLLHIHRTISLDTLYAFVEDVSAQRDREDLLRQDLSDSEKRNYQDELTGLDNRRRLTEYVQKWRAEDPEGQGVMLMMDLDNFKTVNDTAGHAEGDALLRRFAQLLRRQFRENDIKARLGGDEFVVFLTGYLSPETVAKKGERFLQAVHRELDEYYTKYHVSVSIGVAYMDKDCVDFAALYEKADAAMYQAKRIGKDSLYIAPEHRMNG